MALADLWNSDRQQICDKRIDQLIVFAGEGRLRDGNSTSVELRALLSTVPSEVLGQWIDQCLDLRFTDFGLVLQDIVNELGRRLNFRVRHGVYRGHGGEGHDGLWQLATDKAILIESKSSTAYSINLSRIAEYRKQVAPVLGLSPDDISILIVVGTEDTTELEAQVRGSRFAWDVRLLGVRSLFRLLRLKEALDDPEVEKQIQAILVPQEFTRLDRIIDLVFETAEDAQDIDEISAPESDEATDVMPARPRAAFHADILPRLENRFGKSLVKQSRVLWAPPDDSLLVSCQVSKEFEKGPSHYWFGLKRSTKEALQAHAKAYCAFGLGSSARVAVLPYAVLGPLLASMFTSPDIDGQVRHWHVRFEKTADRISLLTNRDQGRVDVTGHLLPT